jgi:hypothetical protein
MLKSMLMGLLLSKYNQSAPLGAGGDGTSPVPEPSSAMLLATLLGTAAAWGIGRRR